MGGAWSLAAASHLPQILLECGNELPDIFRGTSKFETRLTQDNLRAHPAAARSYGELKQRMAAEHPGDRVAYAKAKTDFIAAAMRAARRG